MELGEASDSRLPGQVTVTNRAGHGRVVLVCDHASRYIPPEYGSLGLDASELDRHIAWDPGALPVSLMLSRLLDAPLVAAGMSRLIIDCNRPLDAPDLIPEVSETTKIPGNQQPDEDETARRIALSHAPFHAAIDRLIEERLRARRETWLISVHSFTPVYKSIQRPWHVGILHDDDERLSTPLIAALAAGGGITVGDNQPYSPADRVYYTLARHGRSRGLPCAMIEIRNDDLADESGWTKWAERLAGILASLGSMDAGAMHGRKVS